MTEGTETRASLPERVVSVVRSGGRGDAAIFALGAAVQGIAHGGMAACAGWLGATLVAGEGASSRALVEVFGHRFGPETAVSTCGIALAAAIVKACAGAASTYAQRRLAARVGDDVRRSATLRILHAGRRASASDAAATLAIRLRDVERAVDEGVLGSLRAWLQLLPLALAMIALSSRLAFVSVGALLPFAIGLRWVRRRFRDGYDRSAKLAERLHAGVDHLVRHVDLWRTFGAGHAVAGALDEAGEQAGRAGARADAARAGLSGANEALAAGALLVAVVLAGAGVLRVGDGGGLVAFAAVFFLTYRPLRDLGDARTAVRRGEEAFAALGELAGDAPAEEAAAARTWGAERLVVERVSVSRPGVTTPAVSFTAEPGEVVALIGPTGVGKTSLLRALLGLERSSGVVRYGDLGLDGGVGPAARPFAWVPQEPAIVAATLRANVTFAAPGADARAALEAVGAGALVPRLDEVLDAGGAALSGGERQWVSLARAIATGLPVLLLDEPTSGLDAASQARVLDALRALRGTRTVILVTHRPEPLELADQVIELAPQN